jgi:carbamoyl-phosphate synthase/aspartate carbamoyltransferase/dihydroorotase
MIEIPGLIDIHVHLREPGESYKEDFSTGTSAALRGGITAVLAMPNTNPPILDNESFQMAAELAEAKSYCDFGIYLGGGENNVKQAADLAGQAAGLKLYLNSTYGPLLLEHISSWMAHFEGWPASRPIVAHAEDKTLAAYLLLSHIYQRPVHVCHVARKDEILLIREAKRKGVPVTCEVTPHHLFLTKADGKTLPRGRDKVSPALGTSEDQQALWDNIEIIDCIASDHAPHTLDEKDSEQSPPGYPGLETTLPLLLGAVQEGRLTLEDILQKMFFNPRRIFSIPEQEETRVEVDETHSYEISGSDQFTKAKWTPFEGKKVRGIVKRVVIRGETVYQDGKVTVNPGFGKNIRDK